MGIKSRPHVNKKLLAVIAFLFIIGAVAVASYKAGQTNSVAKMAGNGNQPNTNLATDGEAPEIAEPGRSVFEGYKKQIEENKTEGIERTTLYINAAFSGAFIKAPEAAGYAKEALNTMPSNMRNAGKNKELISNLQLIADGKYDEVKVDRQ